MNNETLLGNVHYEGIGSRFAIPAPPTAGISKEILIGAAALALFILITKNK